MKRRYERIVEILILLMYQSRKYGEETAGRNAIYRNA